MSKNIFNYPPQDLSPYALKSGDILTGNYTTRSIRPSTSITDEVGRAANYYFAVYAQRHYFNSTAVLDGTIPGQIKATGLIMPFQAPTASQPAYVKGAIYFDTTLNKLMIGGATGWETVTSS